MNTNIPTQISEHIEAKAAARAEKHAASAVKPLAETIQKSGGELTIPSATGGTVTINSSFVESLQQAIRLAGTERFQKEEVDNFIQNVTDFLASKDKEEKDKKPPVK